MRYPWLHLTTDNPSSDEVFVVAVELVQMAPSSAAGVRVSSEWRRFCLDVIVILYTTAKCPEVYNTITVLIKSD